eukprot:9994828-Alexandrium_andersonii.AAC.1
MPGSASGFRVSGNAPAAPLAAASADLVAFDAEGGLDGGAIPGGHSATHCPGCRRCLLLPCLLYTSPSPRD